MMNITKLAALAFTSLEYFVMSKEDLLAMEGERLKRVYNYDGLNRSKKNKAEKLIKEHFSLYLKNLNDWERILTKITTHFEQDKSTSKTVDFSIDLLHRALDKFTVSEDVPVEDKVKDHIFNSLDRIKAKARTEQESIMLMAAFDNFLTTNKLISNGK